jgi:predicted nucleotidyltransferase
MKEFGNTIDKTIQILKKILSTLQEIKFAYLFGSYANANFCKHSDIDIAIFLKEEDNNFDTKLSIHHKIQKTLQKEVDLIILNDIKNLYLLEDILDGIILKDSKDNSREMFELKAEHDIKDYKSFQKMIYAA